MGSAHGYLAGVAEMIYTKLIGNDHNNVHELASLLGEFTCARMVIARRLAERCTTAQRRTRIYHRRT